MRAASNEEERVGDDAQTPFRSRSESPSATAATLETSVRMTSERREPISLQRNNRDFRPNDFSWNRLGVASLTFGGGVRQRRSIESQNWMHGRLERNECRKFHSECGFAWWRWGDSNAWPLTCEAVWAISANVRRHWPEDPEGGAEVALPTFLCVIGRVGLRCSLRPDRRESVEDVRDILQRDSLSEQDELSGIGFVVLAYVLAGITSPTLARVRSPLVRHSGCSRRCKRIRIFRVSCST